MAGAEARDLIITGGLRTTPDFIKTLALGADAVAVSNSAMQAIGYLMMRACKTGRCSGGIATQGPVLRCRLPVEEMAERLTQYLRSTVELMTVDGRGPQPLPVRLGRSDHVETGDGSAVWCAVQRRRLTAENQC